MVNQSAKSIKIFVADDHPIVREGLIAVLGTQSDFEIVGEASNGLETIQGLKAGEVQADVLLLDLEMPVMDGLEVIEEINKQDIITKKIIVFTVFDTDERIVRAIKAGAKGYILKGASRSEIFEAIRVVNAGGSLLQPLIASKLLNRISNDVERLSPRELDVMRVLAEGKQNKEIGELLFISERTVKFHVSAILSKLGAKNRTEAVQIARKRGVL